jgi:hypothetical protein
MVCSSALRTDMACFSEISGLLIDPEDGHDTFLRNFRESPEILFLNLG